MASKGELTRRKIIEKATQLFSIQGYHHTSVADIVEACDVSKGALYGHFRSKEEIWYAACAECRRIWKGIVFKGVREIPDPLERIEKVIENSLRDYLGGGIFDGGCFLFNSLVEFSRQSAEMNDHVLKGFMGFSELLHSWLEEADRMGMIEEGIDLVETANFIVMSLNGAGPLYSSSRDVAVLKHAASQLRMHIGFLKKRARDRSGGGVNEGERRGLRDGGMVRQDS